ncbi:MAG: NAD-dependent epimerase/dehydratase family protein [Gammaproteobacteria bacterium]|jgi:nucleoside-diphosphate-sugar epimerase|nr:NAD-dependent epimerase/dehydratase family protein [Gammaproteobacteria bacterium]
MVADAETRPDPSRVIIFGCGYTGERLARAWRERGATVAGVVRSAESARRLEEHGITVRVCDLDELSSPIPDWTGALVYYLVPPPRVGHRDTRLRRLLAGATSQPRRIVYFSTTGVYGDSGGQWIDESEPLAPAAERAQRRADAETGLAGWCEANGVQHVILRVSSIYGPGRLPEARIRRGEPVLRERECGYTNRIFVDDLVELAIAAGERGVNAEAYNACDGQPGTMTGYFFAVADALGLPRPPVISMDQAKTVLSPEMLSYLSESRRISNRKARDRLGVKFLHAGLARGITASLVSHPAASRGTLTE